MKRVVGWVFVLLVLFSLVGCGVAIRIGDKFYEAGFHSSSSWYTD